MTLNIKTNDEKDICNLLLFPNDYPSDPLLDEKVVRIYGEKKEETIANVINLIGKDESKNSFPQSIFLNKQIFAESNKCFPEKVQNSLQIHASWSAEAFECSKMIVEKIHSYNIDNSKLFWTTYFQRLLPAIHGMQTNQITEIRSEILHIFSSEISDYPQLYVSTPETSFMPIITLNELRYLEDIEKQVPLIDVDKIDDANITEISSILIKPNMTNREYSLVHGLMAAIYKRLTASKIAPVLLDFLSITQTVDDGMFAFIVSNDPIIKSITTYFATLKLEQFTKAYLIIVDDVKL